MPTSHFGSSRSSVWIIKHLVSPIQRWLYQISGGRLLSSVGTGRDVLLLTTTGRRTGVRRTTPVFYLRDGDSIILCNVNPGFEHTNPWVLNLRANPVAQLQIGRHIGNYRAREASEKEIEWYWPRLVAMWPAYKEHFDKGGKRTVFILEKMHGLRSLE